ncbi:protein kinase [Schaalia meyeri]|uniref:non-specific serine/threonine protein kinase n=1 Tax=Schaalia meyeri TaxID=52773 RepID=A0AAP9Y9Q0_9ACTO|nr:serine/threonine-protein kinase [Schaalia meyeri]QQC44781.1 protein kinase [Schaalia meyeri]SDS14731.1 serine/threonine protein kinase [Schaalia meyeri]
MTSGAGRVLGGRYTLLTPIAQGGMGEVWKARDRVSGHIVAAKVLRPELTGEELSLSRLRLEARNSMAISHPNIANTQDSGQEEGIGWIIMELVDGYPLTDYLRGGSRIEPEYLMPILVQVAMALGAAARAGVVHRDIKPANILVRPDGMVKLTDFGISRAKGQVNLTAAGMVMGTAQYLPPEQAMGEIATPIGDLYALGVIAYEAAAGRRPFTGETQVDIAFSHVNDPVPSLPDFVPAPLADVILHLLEKDPAKRPESGSAAVREIASAAKAMGISVTPRPLPLPKSAQHPTEIRTPVQPSVPIVAPVRHLTRRTLPDEMLQPPSGLTPKVRSVSGRHAMPVLDEATTIAPSSAPIPTTGRHASAPRVLDEAEVSPAPRPAPAPAPARVRRLHPETGEHAAPVSGTVRSLTSTGRHAAAAPAASAAASASLTGAPVPVRSAASAGAAMIAGAAASPKSADRPQGPASPARATTTPAGEPTADRPQGPTPRSNARASHPAPSPTPPTKHAPSQSSAGPSRSAADPSSSAAAPEDRRAALAERLRQRAEHRQAEDVAEEQRRARVAREEEQRKRELRETRKRREAEQAQRQHAQSGPQRFPHPAPGQDGRRKKESTASSTPRSPSPAPRSASSSSRSASSSTHRVYGTVPQPRTKKPSTRPRRSVYEPQPEKTSRGPRWHELDARTAQHTRPPTKTAYSRSAVAPPVPVSRHIIRAVVAAIIVIALIALLAITIRHMLGSLIHPSAGAHIIEEVRTWQSPWPTV